MNILEIGLAQGRKLGMEQGRVEGIEQGLEQGIANTLVKNVEAAVHSNWSYSKIFYLFHHPKANRALPHTVH